MRAGILSPRGAGRAELNPTKAKVAVVVILPAYLHSCGGIFINIVSWFRGTVAADTVAVSAAHKQGRYGGHGASLPNPSSLLALLRRQVVCAQGHNTYVLASCGCI